MKEKYTIVFYVLTKLGNLHILGQFFADKKEDVDCLINKGKKQFGIHLRTNDNMRVFILDEDGNTLGDYTFEPSECKTK